MRPGEVVYRPWEAATPARQTPDLLGVDAVIPSSKVPHLKCKHYVAELMAGVAERVAALERGRANHEESIDALAEAVTVLQNQASRKASVRSKAAK